MPSRGRTSWPGRETQPALGRATFQCRGGQVQTPPITPPPSPIMASQTNRLAVSVRAFTRGRGRGRGRASVCLVCQREGCFSWNHPTLANSEPPTLPPQGERAQQRSTTSPRPGCYVCGKFGCHSDFHRDEYVPPPFQRACQPGSMPSLITEPETGFGVRVRASPFLSARALIRSSVVSGSLTPRGRSRSTQTWKPTETKVAQTLITASCEIAPTAESKLSSFVESFSDRTPDEQAAMVSLFPARIVKSNSPIMNATIRSVPCRMLVDTGGQVSVIPPSLCQKLKPPVNLPVTTCEVATYGNITELLHGPVPLYVQLGGLTILHPFYIVDDSKAVLAPTIGGYDLMKTGRMVLDIDNQLLWPRLTHSLTDHPSPNPTMSIPNTDVRSVVCFADPPLQSPSEERDYVSQDVELPTVQCEPDAEDQDPASIAPERSSVLSR